MEYNFMALFVAIILQCRVEEAFLKLENPNANLYLKNEDYIDMSNLLKAGSDFDELAIIYNRKKANLQPSYSRKIQELNLYSTAVKNKIEEMDKIAIKYMITESNRSVEIIKNRFSEYLPEQIEEFCLGIYCT